MKNNTFAYLSDSERRGWLARTERELTTARERLAECRREGRSTVGAEIEIAALLNRTKALLTVKSSASAYRPSPKTYTASREIKSAATSREAEERRVLAEFKARQDRDALLRRIYGE